MKLYVYTLCKNEVVIAPFVVKYWKNIADKFIVYDNGSTDGTREYLEQFDWIEVRNGNSINKGMNDFLNQQLKNLCWQECKDTDVDFVYVCDFDEVLWSPNLKLDLETIKEDGYNIISTHLFFVSSEEFPLEDQLVHTQKGIKFLSPNCTYDDRILNKYEKDGFNYGKVQLFNPNDIIEMRFAVGNHQYEPIGNNINIFDCIDNEVPIIMFHLTPLNYEYFISKLNTRSAQLSNYNRSTVYGKQYEITEEEKQEEFEQYRLGVTWEELKTILKID